MSELTAEQKKEWVVLSKVVRAYSKHNVKVSKFEMEVFKSFYFQYPLPVPTNGFEEIDLYCISEENYFLRILLSPDQSEQYYRSVLSSLQGSGSAASKFPITMNNLYKETGFALFAGRTEWLIELLMEKKQDDLGEWLRPFWHSELLTCVTDWLKNGGYRQLPVVPPFSSCIERYLKRLKPVNYNDERFSRLKNFYLNTFNFQDPENLPPEESPYYYFASHAQHHLCQEAELPEPLEQYIIKVAMLDVEHLADYKCLPILPRPACYDEVPPIVKPSAKKAKAPQECYDEHYPDSDDYPYPPLRYYGEGEVIEKETLATVLDLFKARKFYKRKPAIKLGDPTPFLFSEWTNNPPQLKKTWMCQFAPHPRFAMSDELALNITLITSKSAVPMEVGDYDMDDDHGPVGISTTEAKANLILYIEQPNREEIADDSSLMKNIQQLLKAIKEKLGIELQEGVEASELPSP